MAVWRGLGLVVLVLLGIAIALLRGIDAWRKEAVIAELHLPPAFTLARDFDFGRYRLSWRGQGGVVHPQGRPDKVLWAIEGGFLAAGTGQVVSAPLEPGRMPRDRRERLCREQSLESFERLGGRLQLKGFLRCSDGSLSRYLVVLEDDGERGLTLTVNLEKPELNRLYLTWRREEGEQVFGLGEPSGAYDLSGRRVSVPATGHGRRAATSQGIYVTSRLRAFHSQSDAYQLFDLRDPRRVGLEVHAGRLMAHIYKGDSLEELRAHWASVLEAVSTPRTPK
ncbi:hypothetical protein [Pseudomonas sp. Q1-7]|uniref:hypothetical protein n=1 Tax=Pseudomonas sp. Q1-7 TaxID=3020843 RepID=UPI0023011A7E|nr:hypothetical protein [Pseudomonas sp. Q1-7]